MKVYNFKKTRSSEDEFICRTIWQRKTFRYFQPSSGRVSYYLETYIDEGLKKRNVGKYFHK